jgi:hypothetical protein
MKRSVGILISATVIGLAAAPAAQATFTMNPQIDFAKDPIAVGSSGAGTLSFSNDSTAGEHAVSIERIVLEPSCRFPGEQPPCTNREPGIFSIGTGTGVTGTSCQGITFNVGLGMDPFGGSLQFNPSSAIPDMPVNASCLIKFTYTALAVPTFDTQGETGVQTDQLAEVRADSGGGPIGFGPGTGDTTVTPAPPVTPVTPVTPVVPVTPAAPSVTPAPKKCKKNKKKGKKAAAAKKCKKKKKGR